MVQKYSIENFIRKAIWRITRSGDIIKYIPKSIHNGVVVGDCAVIRNKIHTFDVYTKNRKPIKKDICNHKIAICIATIMNQYHGNLQQKLVKLSKLDNEYAVQLGKYHDLKSKIDSKPHLEQEMDQVTQQIIKLSDEIEAEYTAMTL